MRLTALRHAARSNQRASVDADPEFLRARSRTRHERKPRPAAGVHEVAGLHERVAFVELPQVAATGREKRMHARTNAPEPDEHAAFESELANGVGDGH